MKKRWFLRTRVSNLKKNESYTQPEPEKKLEKKYYGGGGENDFFCLRSEILVRTVLKPNLSEFMLHFPNLFVSLQHIPFKKLIKMSVNYITQ